MKRIRKHVGALVLGAVLGGGLVSARGHEPSLPADVELPAAATSPEVEARSKSLRHSAELSDPAETTSGVLSQIEEIQMSTLPTIGRERLLFEASEILVESGTMQAVPALRELSRQQPEAMYTIPDEREPYTLAYFNYSAMARVAADAIDYRDSVTQFTDAFEGEPRELLLAALDEQEPARVRGALDALQDRAWNALLVEPALVRTMPRPALGAVILSAEHQDRADVLASLARTLDGAHARQALVAHGRVRHKTGDGPDDALQLMADRPEVLGAIALGTLEERDATPDVLARLKDLLSDPGLGADAVAALQRLDDGAARNVALDVLANPGSAVAERRAVLLLMRDGTPPARHALGTYVRRPAANQADQVLKEKVIRWLAN